MGLNKQRGNMYPFVTHTWNVFKGKCPHDCFYCYMKVFRLPELHFDEKEMRTDLGEGNFIFVGSSCDMWADVIPMDQIDRILVKCREYNNRYLFQSKNPGRFQHFLEVAPLHSVFGTTIESNRGSWTQFSLAPLPYYRYKAMRELPGHKMVSIEPVMDFELFTMVKWIREIAPDFVSIGADSKGHHLPEPPPDKLNRLIEELAKYTEVKIKDNLSRLR